MSPRAVIDATQQQVLVPDVPSRIVSLIPSITEILFSLGLGPSIVGVTLF
jgi:iron complex transport system substrate-binding protein